LPDRMAIYTRWFTSCKDADGNVSRSAIALLFVKIELARDFETASIQLDSRLKELTDQKIVSLGVFLRLFMRSIFTECLTQVIKLIQESSDDNLSLDLKVSNFKRMIKMQGITPVSVKAVHSPTDFLTQELEQAKLDAGLKNLESLRKLRCETDADLYHYNNYTGYLKDPMG